MLRKITEIILHCSATTEGKVVKAATIDKWHRAKGWNGIGYHYVIDLDGTVERGRALPVMGAHCVGHNAESIGICYIGGLGIDGKTPKDTRTFRQKVSLLNLVDDLLRIHKLSINNVHCHYEYANKACPCFKIEAFRKEYTDWKSKLGEK